MLTLLKWINLSSNVSFHCWNLFTTSINRKAENGIWYSLLHSLPSSWAVVKVNEIWKEEMLYRYSIGILWFINCVFLLFIYTGDITTLPAMSLQDQNHWVLLRGAGRCGDHEGWVTLSVHLYINRYINIYQYCISVLIWESEELLVTDFFFTKS